MRISLESLQVLDAIDRQGSFSAAAAALHRVPSAISHTVARLEDELDLPLFVRSGRSVQLTPAGRVLLEDGRRLLDAAGELERRVRRVATGWEAELRLAVDMILPAERLFPLIARFSAAGHGTRLSLGAEVLGGSWDALITGRADLVVGATGEKPAVSGISTRALGEAKLVFAVAPGHPLAAVPEPIPPEELRRHRAVVIADTARELAGRTAGLPDVQDTLRVPDMAAKAAAQAAGLGIGHLPPWLAAPLLADGRLVARRLAEPPPAQPTHVAWRTRQEGKALAWFLEALDEPAVRAALTEGLAASLPAPL